MTGSRMLESRLADLDAPALLRALTAAVQEEGEGARLRPAFTEPSVLRGARDLSEWGCNHRAVRALLAGALERFFDHGGQGVGEAFSAEVLYERGLFGEALPEALAAGRSPIPEIACAGGVLAARIDPGTADEHLARAQAAAECCEALGPGFEAARARIAAYRGDAAAMEAWLASAPAPADMGAPQNRYLLLARGFVLLALGRVEEAKPLYDALCGALRGACRPLDYAEALCGAALAAGDAPGVRQAARPPALRGYRMICAEFGEPVAALLETDPACAEWVRAARAFSARWRKDFAPSVPAEEAERGAPPPAEADPPAPEEDPSPGQAPEREARPKGKKRG